MGGVGHGANAGVGPSLSKVAVFTQQATDHREGRWSRKGPGAGGPPGPDQGGPSRGEKCPAQGPRRKAGLTGWLVGVEGSGPGPRRLWFAEQVSDMRGRVSHMQLGGGSGREAIWAEHEQERADHMQSVGAPLLCTGDGVEGEPRWNCDRCHYGPGPGDRLVPCGSPFPRRQWVQRASNCSLGQLTKCRSNPRRPQPQTLFLDPRCNKGSLSTNKTCKKQAVIKTMTSILGLARHR